MKKNLLALAALSTFAVSSYAQSNVTIYGLLDAGVEYVNHANVKKDGVVRLSSGAMNTSRIGFRGTEDLGGGLKAVFQLENGFKLDTGEFDSAGLLFNRQANVGLEGSFGRIVAGRSFSTTYDFILPFDLMGYSGQYSWVTSGNATGGRKDGMITTVPNMIKYLGSFGSFKVGATYGFGEVAGSTGDTAKFSVAGSYGAGPFSVATAFDRSNGTAAIAGGGYDKATSVHLAGLYQFGEDWKFNLGYRNYKKTLASHAADLRSDLFWGGASYRVTPVVTLIGQIYYQNIKNVAAGKDADPIMYSVRAKYALSKRTDLYLSGAYAKAKNNQLVGVSRDDVGFGTSQTGVIGGIQHRF
ncbi:porin [Glaciimonas sp. PCH181]|uniref:porin n=1 Tax=Glaciimonas sp. PCH181 TaxID=2133943 RepID=UPI000D3365D3|nr:porin [Glaciimonas sp. PCH181]PUA17931.1 porin [Glaciimonas sp. PCH181]